MRNFFFGLLFTFAVYAVSGQDVINSYTEWGIPGGTSNFNPNGGLIVNDTLIVFGNLNLDNNEDLVIGSNGVLIVFGDLVAKNKVDVNLGGYFIVTGNFSKNGSSGEITDNGGELFIFDDTPTWGAPPAPPGTPYGDEETIVTDPIFEFFQELVDSQCALAISSSIITDVTTSGGSDGAIDIETIGAVSPPPSYSWSNGATTQDISSLTAGDYIVNVYEGYCFFVDTIPVAEPCCPSTSYYSKNNYSGNWEDIATWGSPDEAWRPLPPPTDGASIGFTQPICILGYVTLNGDYTTNGGNQYLCDTLVITGSFYADNPTLVIESTGVLIVLGDYIGLSGTINNGGRVIFSGEFTQPYDLSGTGDYYVFDPTPTVPGWFGTTTYDESELQTNDPSLFTFYQSISCGAGVSGGTIGTNETICQGDNASEIVNVTDPSPAGSTTFEWYYSTNSTDPASGTWSVVTDSLREALLPVPLATTTSFFRLATVGSGCTANSNVVTIIVSSLPSPAITSGAISVCEDEAIDYITDGTGTLTWSVSAGGTIMAGQGTTTVTIQWNTLVDPNAQSSSETVTIEESDGICSGTASCSVTLSRIPQTGPGYHIPNTFKK